MYVSIMAPLECRTSMQRLRGNQVFSIGRVPSVCCIYTQVLSRVPRDFQPLCAKIQRSSGAGYWAWDYVVHDVPLSLPPLQEPAADQWLTAAIPMQSFEVLLSEGRMGSLVLRDSLE